MRNTFINISSIYCRR